MFSSTDRLSRDRILNESHYVLYVLNHGESGYLVYGRYQFFAEAEIDANEVCEADTTEGILIVREISSLVTDLNTGH